MKKTKSLIYASDLDRTLIFSNKFLTDYSNNRDTASYIVVEKNGDRDISYMPIEVNQGLIKLNSDKRVHFIPVTTRSLDEYNKIDLGFIPEYAIVANGGKILYNGKELEEYSEYIKSSLNMMELLEIKMDIECELQSVNYNVKMIDNCYLFFKTNNPNLFDLEIVELRNKYHEIDFVRQRNKCYAIPKHFSKQVALRWLWHKLGKPYIVASGDSELDLPMLSLANKAVVPSHGELITQKFILDGTIVKNEEFSPLQTFEIVNSILNK